MSKQKTRGEVINQVTKFYGDVALLIIGRIAFLGFDQYKENTKARKDVLSAVDAEKAK